MKLMKVLPLFIFLVIQYSSTDKLFAKDTTGNDSATIVIENAVVAMGGKEYLSSIRTLYTDMSVQTEGKAIHWIKKDMLPNKSIFEVVNNDKTVFYQCFNGTKGYELLNSNKLEQDAEELKDKKKQKNIFAELDYLNKALWTVEMAGNKRVNGEDCYRIKVFSPNGALKFLCYSKKTFLKISEEIPQNMAKEKYKTTIFGGYKKYGKLVYYTTLQSENTAIARMEKLLTNEKVSSADFKD
jgi:hypothetical protein